MWRLFASIVIGFGSCSSSPYDLRDAVMLASLFYFDSLDESELCLRCNIVQNYQKVGLYIVLGN